MAGPVWTERWTRLRDAGLTREQALAVWEVIDEARGHHSQTLAQRSREALDAVFPDDFTCPGCGVNLWCASMDHGLDECDEDCQFFESGSAWCCAECPAGECDGGQACDMCACQDDLS